MRQPILANLNPANLNGQLVNNQVQRHNLSASLSNSVPAQRSKA